MKMGVERKTHSVRLCNNTPHTTNKHPTPIRCITASQCRQSTTKLTSSQRALILPEYFTSRAASATQTRKLANTFLKVKRKETQAAVVPSTTTAKIGIPAREKVSNSATAASPMQPAEK